jgi:acyl-CoA synthetase (AMP-forming)/AMP-acid ligase II
LTLSAEFDRAVELWPDCAFTYLKVSERSETVLTLSELRTRALALANGFRRLGLAQGEAIAVQLPNWPEALITYYAAARLGLVIVPVPDIYSASELSFILKETAASALVMPESWRNVGFRERLGDAQTETLEHLIIVGDEHAGTVTFSSLCEGGEDEGLLAQTKPTDLAVVIYTSGSSQNPKGVVHSHETFLSEVHSSPFGPQGDLLQRFLLCAPPGHMGGFLGLMRSTVFGCASYALDSWDTEQAKRAVQVHHLTSSAGPYFLESLLEAFDSSGEVPPPMRWALGGTPVPRTLCARAEAVGWLSFRSYGSSEHPTSTGALYSDSVEVRTQTDGYLLGANRIRVIDEEGFECQVDHEGELVSMGPEQFLGYLSPSLNEQAFTSDGWFRSGDVGFVDEAGCVVLTDRIKDIVIRGGENISVKEVEAILTRHPAITEAAVVPYPDERYGERVAAIVIVRDGIAPPTPEDLAKFFVGEGVAKQKTPERVLAVEAFPRTVIGKIDKRELRRMASVVEPG